MQKQTAAALGAAILLGLVCAVLAVRAHAQSQEIAALKKQFAIAMADAKAARETADTLKEHKKILDDESKTLRKKIVALQAAQPATASQPDVPAPKKGQSMKSMLAKMMSDPEMRKATLSQQRVFFKSSYAGLFKELGLTPDQQEKLLDIITDRQGKMMEASFSMFGEDGADKQVATKAIADLTKSSGDEIKAFLGDANYQKFTDWEANAPTRMAMDQLKQQFAGTATPLQDFQTTQLSQIMQEETTRPSTQFPNTDFSQAQKDPTFFASPENVDNMIAHIADVNQRVLARAQGILNSDQLQKLQSFQTSQLEMQKLGLKMAAKMFGSDDGDSTVQPNINIQVQPAPK